MDLISFGMEQAGVRDSMATRQKKAAAERMQRSMGQPQMSPVSGGPLSQPMPQMSPVLQQQTNTQPDAFDKVHAFANRIRGMPPPGSPMPMGGINPAGGQKQQGGLLDLLVALGVM
tara:strand:+ start:22961 stop:23308 length:348 start_codon:yes stop_codon:yes gene_type:complete